MSDPSLRRTPLYAAHRELGARLIDFGGWEMPLQYAPGIVREHQRVRSAAGLFDVSHMGEITLRGPKAGEAVQALITNDLQRIGDGGALYTLLCNDEGGILDDCIVYRRSSDDFLIIVNASNHDKDAAWIRDHAGGAELVDESDKTALIAVQGPLAVSLTDGVSEADLAAIRRFHFAMAPVCGVRSMVARTGYTGEDGFEIACPAESAEAVWDGLLEAGRESGVLPIGLGARDTLRLEAALCLYGNDIDETTTPLEAGLGWAVKLEAGPFVGREALRRQKAAGIERKLVQFTISGRGIARKGYDIVDRELDEPVIGTVTSGTTGITVGGAIGMGYVPVDRAAPKTPLTIDCRGKDVPATVIKGPFYQRES